MIVKGIDLDAHTRCRHYDTERDIIAIKFKCCDTFYACFECHEELANHPSLVWDKEERSNTAVLCGSCSHQLTIQEYMDSKNTCPKCHAAFNPGCQNHYLLYFGS